MRIVDTNDLKATARECGSYFFEPKTMRYFDSRLIDVEPTSEDTLTGYFLTSERDKWNNRPRKYSVRAYTVVGHEHEDGTGCHRFNVEKIETYSTLAKARTDLRKQAEAERMQS